jgi:hypothetical protein
LKKIAAILLLSVLLFNWIGYRLLSAYWEDHAASRLQASLDQEQFDPAETITLRISADALPYSTASVRFERSEGIIEVGAVRYRTVKRRLYNDSIEFLCIPDGPANKLRAARNDFFSLVNDLQKTGHSKIPGQSGKTNPPVNKIVWFETRQFTGLPYLADHPARYPLPPSTAPTAGHLRIGLQPPRPCQPSCRPKACPPPSLS